MHAHRPARFVLAHQHPPPPPHPHIPASPNQHHQLAPLPPSSHQYNRPHVHSINTNLPTNTIDRQPQVLIAFLQLPHDHMSLYADYSPYLIDPPEHFVEILQDMEKDDPE
jgi:hypothetical protein